jgi:hypothetical protein
MKTEIWISHGGGYETDREWFVVEPQGDPEAVAAQVAGLRAVGRDVFCLPLELAEDPYAETLAEQAEYHDLDVEELRETFKRFLSLSYSEAKEKMDPFERAVCIGVYRITKIKGACRTYDATVERTRSGKVAWVKANGCRVGLLVKTDPEGTEYVQLVSPGGHLEGIEPGRYYPSVPAPVEVSTVADS